MEVEDLWHAELSEQNQQQEQIWNLTQWLKNEASESLTDNNLMKLCNDALLIVEVDLSMNETSSQTVLENYNKYLTLLQNLQSFESLNQGFNDFTNILISFQSDTKLAILEALANKESEIITNYFTENWFPTNQLEFEIFSRKFKVSVDKYSVIEGKDVQLTNVDEANIENLTNIYQVIESTADNSEVFILLQQLSEGKDEVYPKIKSLLLSQPEELAKLLDAVIDADTSNNTTHYESLKRTLLDIDPMFSTVIMDYENKNHHKIDSLYKAHVYSLSWEKPKLNGSFLESKNGHGDNISIDLTKKPPFRTLSLSNSEYALEANRDLWELHKPNLEYQNKKTEISTQLRVINILQTASIQEHIADLINQEYGLPEIKKILKFIILN